MYGEISASPTMIRLLLPVSWAIWTSVSPVASSVEFFGLAELGRVLERRQLVGDGHHHPEDHRDDRQEHQRHDDQQQPELLDLGRLALGPAASRRLGFLTLGSSSGGVPVVLGAVLTVVFAVGS